MFALTLFEPDRVHCMHVGDVCVCVCVCVCGSITTSTLRGVSMSGLHDGNNPKQLIITLRPSDSRAPRSSLSLSLSLSLS